MRQTFPESTQYAHLHALDDVSPDRSGVVVLLLLRHATAFVNHLHLKPPIEQGNWRRALVLENSGDAGVGFYAGRYRQHQACRVHSTEHWSLYGGSREGSMSAEMDGAGLLCDMGLGCGELFIWCTQDKGAPQHSLVRMWLLAQRHLPPKQIVWPEKHFPHYSSTGDGRIRQPLSPAQHNRIPPSLPQKRILVLSVTLTPCSTVFHQLQLNCVYIYLSRFELVKSRLKKRLNKHRAPPRLKTERSK